MALATSKNLRPSGLELGDKSALIVFEDAEADKDVEWAIVRTQHGLKMFGTRLIFFVYHIIKIIRFIMLMVMFECTLGYPLKTKGSPPPLSLAPSGPMDRSARPRPACSCTRMRSLTGSRRAQRPLISAMPAPTAGERGLC